jgi:hypothetical protein
MKLFALFATIASASGSCATCEWDSTKIKVTHLQSGYDGHKCYIEGEGFYTVCGNSKVCKAKPDAELPSTKHEVRCCSDTKHKGYIKNAQCSVWGESDIPTCIHAATWAQADAHCKKDGARLCTKDELANDCTSGSGCNHDVDMIWSSTPVTKCACECSAKQHHVVCGATNVCKNAPKVAADTEKHEVRCCSDKQHKGYIKNAQCSVWAESDIPTCIHAATWAQADAHCKKDGARLCTKDELANDCTRGSGCNHDADMIWAGN